MSGRAGARGGDWIWAREHTSRSQPSIKRRLNNRLAALFVDSLAYRDQLLYPPFNHICTLAVGRASPPTPNELRVKFICKNYLFVRYTVTFYIHIDHSIYWCKHMSWREQAALVCCKTPSYADSLTQASKQTCVEVCYSQSHAWICFWMHNGPGTRTGLSAF